MFNNVLKNTMYANTLLIEKLRINDREYSFDIYLIGNIV